jgi:hypothetical protein
MVKVFGSPTSRSEVTRPIKWSLNALPFLVALLLVTVIPKLEAWLMPVITNFTVTSVSRVNNTLVISGYLRKDRDCAFVGVSAIGLGGDRKVAVPLVFRDSLYDNNATRPQGTQAWGPWTLQIPVVPHIQTVDLDSTHTCHPLWTTTTHMAAIPVIGVMQ